MITETEQAKNDTDTVEPESIDAATDATSETESRVNPYAVTRSQEPVDDAGTETGAEAETETEELTYRSDGDSWY
mgnify:FL=1